MIFLILLILLFCSDAFATDRYASPAGSGTTCSSGVPCSVTTAISQAQAGETVYFQDGTYTAKPNSVRSGTASLPITFRAVNRRQATFQLTGAQCIDIRHSNIRLIGFVLDGQGTNCTSEGIRFYGVKGPPQVFLTGNVVEDMRITAMGGKYLWAGAVDGIIIRYNDFDGGTGLVNVTNSCSGLYLGSYDGSSLVKNAKIYGNTVARTTCEGIDHKPQSYDNETHHNLFDEIGYYANASGYSLWPSPQSGVFVMNKANHIHDNIIQGYKAVYYGGCVSAFSGGTVIAGARFNNNVCRDSVSPAVALGGSANSGLGDVDNNTFCNLASNGTAGTNHNYHDNTGFPPPNADASVCDAEEARIVSEIAARPVIASAEIGLTAADKIRITWTNDKFPPLASVDNSKITCTVAGVARTVNSSSIIGTNITEHTLASAVSAGQAVICAGTLGLVVNSGQLGPTWIYDLAESAALTTGSGGVPSIVNNVGGGATHNFATTNFQAYGIRMISSALSKLPHTAAAVNTNIKVVPGASFVLAIQTDCTAADCPPTGELLYYAKNGGSYAALPAAFGADNVRIGTSRTGTDIPTEGTVVSSCLAGALTPVNGLTIASANAIPTFDAAQDGCVVNRWLIEFDTDVSPGDYYEFRPYNQDTSALNGYTVTPRVDIISERGGGGT